MNRQALETYYQKRCRVQDNLGPHMLILRKLAEECDVVVEFGTQMCRSTVAFLLGAKKHVYSYDIEEYRDTTRQVREWAGDVWTFEIADSRNVGIPECDLLFIDTEHTFVQLEAELKNAGHKARRYLVFHDTTLFGLEDASGRGEDTVPRTPGLLAAITAYQQQNPAWQSSALYTDRYGLLVLERKP